MQVPELQAGALVPVLPTDEEGPVLCPEHRELLLDDAEEFRRRGAPSTRVLAGAPPPFLRDESAE